MTNRIASNTAALLKKIGSGMTPRVAFDMAIWVGTLCVAVGVGLNFGLGWSFMAGGGLVLVNAYSVAILTR